MAKEVIHREEFWHRYAEDLMPYGAVLKSVDYIKKTTLEMRWKTKNMRHTHWLIINYKFRGRTERIKIGVV